MARKGENIYKRKDGRWEGRYVKGHAEGRTKFGYIYGKSYHEAKEKLVAAKSAWTETKRKVEEKRENFETIGGLWLEDNRKFLKESTVTKYQDYLNCYINPKLGMKGMADTTDQDVADFCIALLKNGGCRGQGLSEKTVIEVNRVIRSLRKYAIKRGCKVGYSCDSITIHQKKEQMRVLNRKEQDALRKQIETNPSLCNVGILLCLDTGIRIGELCALKWKDISM